ncbi:MAG: glycerol-3-phosphate 1-O-acyltransferase PlsY [Bacteroidota bacterium]
MIITIAIALTIAYLLGSIPSAVWYGKKFHDTDVRTFGSGNAGATNTFRVLGKKAGAIVMAIDAFKGCLATYIPVILLNNQLIETNYISSFQIGFGIIAVIGHIFPIFAKFKGGKGVATLLGMAIALHPSAALTCVSIFTIILITTNYVSLGSIIAGLAFPILLFTPMYNNNDLVLKVFGFVVFVLLMITHKQNIGRLMNGTENKIYLLKK